MFFIRYLILFFGTHITAKREDFSFVHDVVESVLGYFGSPSVIFVLDEEHLGSWDLMHFLKLQTLLSSENFYFSSLSTPSTAFETFRSRFQTRKETVVLLQPDETLTRCVEKFSNETDISSYKWLLLSVNGSSSLEKVKIPLPSEFVLAQGNHSAGYDLSEIYNTAPDRKVSKVIGRWAVGNPLVLTSSEDLFHRRKNLEGAAIKVLSSTTDPCIDTSFVVGVAPIVQCIHKRIWDIFAEMLNATTEVLLMPDLDREAIQTTEAELTFRSAPLNPYDFGTRSYLWPVFRVRVDVVASYLPQRVEWRTFILPFSGQMWMVILVWVLVCDLVLAVVGFFDEWKSNERTFWQNWAETSLTAAFILFNQASPTPIKFISWRIILLTMLTVPCVLFPGYSASLTSFLTVTLSRAPFRTLEELSRKDEYKLGWHRSFALENMFNLNDNSPLNEALLRNNVLPQEKMPVTDMEGVDRMCNEKFVFLTLQETLRALKPKCKYYRLKQHFRTVFTSMEIRKTSWYHYFLNRCERTLQFTGIESRIKVQTVMKYLRLYERETIVGGGSSPIVLKNIVLPFAILLLGVFSSGFVLAVEMVCFEPKARRKRHEMLLSRRAVGVIEGPVVWRTWWRHE